MFGEVRAVIENVKRGESESSEWGEDFPSPSIINCCFTNNLFTLSSPLSKNILIVCHCLFKYMSGSEG